MPTTAPSLARAGLYSWLALTAASCRSNSPGESDYAPVAGTFTAVEGAPMDKVLYATVDALRDLQLRPMEREMDAFSVFIVGEIVMGAIAQSHELRVHLYRESDTTTKIVMRILGRRDGDRLRLIHHEIQKRLARTPTAPPK